MKVTIRKNLKDDATKFTIIKGDVNKINVDFNDVYININGEEILVKTNRPSQLLTILESYKGNKDLYIICENDMFKEFILNN